MRRAVYAGSFDPFHNGHLEIVKKASKLFDEVYVVIATNPNKERHYDKNEMVKAIQLTFHDENLLNCFCFCAADGEYTVEVARSIKAEYLIRGLRDIEDFEYEMNMADTNSKLAPEIETIFIRAVDGVSHLSSTYVRYLMDSGYEELAKKHLSIPVFKVCKGEKIYYES